MGYNLICAAASKIKRIAVLKDDRLVDLHVESSRSENLVGNIYKGVVTKSLPGIGVAFVDIGLDRAGFLCLPDMSKAALSDAPETLEDDAPIDCANVDIGSNGSRAGRFDNLQIDRGSLIMAQVSKGPIASKGPRLSSYLTLPGRYLVMIPNDDQARISRRIDDEVERARLKNLLIKVMGSERVGYIARTAAEGRSEDELIRDAEYLGNLWRAALERFENELGPALLHQELDLIERSIRDMNLAELDSVVIDDEVEFERVERFCRAYLPEVAPKLKLYDRGEPIFDHYTIEVDFARALGRKVWLKSGAYIVIEQTEALTAIDVNTGKFTDARDQREAALVTNIEAAKEIACQVKLRDIGGLIVIDFIDMDDPADRARADAALRGAFEDDRRRTKILGISEFGLVEMTRKRARDSLERALKSPCQHCFGSGMVKSAMMMTDEIYRAITRAVRGARSRPVAARLVARPEVTALMMYEETDRIEKIEADLGIKLRIESDHALHQEKFELTLIERESARATPERTEEARGEIS